MWLTEVPHRSTRISGDEGVDHRSRGIVTAVVNEDELASRRLPGDEVDEETPELVEARLLVVARHHERDARGRGGVGVYHEP